jgi:hypothetical protein
MRIILGMKNPKNLQAIGNWVRKNRPDLVGYLPMAETNDAMILLLTVGFEAGRQFQHDNATMPLNQPEFYLSHD